MLDRSPWLPIIDLSIPGSWFLSGMRRFLIDTRNQCATFGSHGTERNSSDNEAQGVPHQAETQPILEPQEIPAETQINL